MQNLYKNRFLLGSFLFSLLLSGTSVLASRDALRLILAEASKDSLPTTLQLVCKKWRNTLREDQATKPGIKFSGLNPFMKSCMETYWQTRFNNGVLSHTDPVTMEVRNYKISDYQGTLYTSNKLVITKDMERFCKVGEENADRAVILIVLRHQFVKMLAQNQTLAENQYRFTSILDSWDAGKAPIGIFWRWGNEENLTQIDYLTWAGMGDISSRNVYQNWGLAMRSSRVACFGDEYEAPLASCFVFNLVNLPTIEFDRRGLLTITHGRQPGAGPQT